MNFFSHLPEKPLNSFLVGCGLHARAPQQNPQLDAVQRTTIGTVMEGAVEMELGARYFACSRVKQWGKKARERHHSLLHRSLATHRLAMTPCNVPPTIHRSKVRRQGGQVPQRFRSERINGGHGTRSLLLSSPFSLFELGRAG